MNLEDSLGRRFRYLRLSLTEQCNFRCVYCLPDGYKPQVESTKFLSGKEISRLGHAFAGLGIEKIRLTGGEPTLRSDLCEIAQELKAISGVKTVALSTNGHDLLRRAPDYLKAGITHLNVSLDDVDPGYFLKFRGTNRGQSVVQGIERALDCGFTQVKANAVLMKEDWQERLERFVSWVKPRNLSIRFIELMQTTDREEFYTQNHVSSNGIHQWLIGHGWVPQARGEIAGPAVEYSCQDSQGRIGIIAPYSKGFCDSCNRLRVSSQGALQLCLFGVGQISLRDLLAGDDQRGVLQNRIIEALRLKKPMHLLHDQDAGTNHSFSNIGG